MITFGICSDLTNIGNLNKVASSIDDLGIPNREIIIVGSYHSAPDDISSWKNCNIILTDGWITRKKNLIAKFATYDTIVMLHDYFTFDDKWYENYKKFGFDWDICSNPQLLINGKRHFTDWVNWDHPNYPKYHSFKYTDWSNTKNQYISGGYFLVKRDFLREHPLNESMKPGDPEDVEWSLRVRDKALIKCNPDSYVRHVKEHRDYGRIGFPFEQE